MPSPDDVITKFNALSQSLRRERSNALAVATRESTKLLEQAEQRVRDRVAKELGPEIVEAKIAARALKKRRYEELDAEIVASYRAAFFKLGVADVGEAVIKTTVPLLEKRGPGRPRTMGAASRTCATVLAAEQYDFVFRLSVEKRVKLSEALRFIVDEYMTRYSEEAALQRAEEAKRAEERAAKKAAEERAMAERRKKLEAELAKKPRKY